MTPEEKAWQQNGAQLTASGGSVQTKDEIHLSACRDVAICEPSFATNEPDYYLFVYGKTSGTLDAKFTGVNYTSLKRQSRSPILEMERWLSVAEVLKSVVSANLQCAARLRQSILQKAFTGELVDEQTADNQVIHQPKKQRLVLPITTRSFKNKRPVWTSQSQVFKSSFQTRRKNGQKISQMP